MRRIYLLPSLLAHLCSPKVVGLLWAGSAMLILPWFFHAVRVFAVPNQHIQAWIGQKNLPIELASPAVIENENYLYVIGGKDKDDKPVDRVQLVQINPNGTLGDWKYLSALPAPLYFHAATKAKANDGKTYIYVIGGWDGVRWRSEIWSTQIQSDGDINGWSKIANYTDRIASHNALVVSNHYLYILGGENEHSDVLDKVAFATISVTGTLQTDGNGETWTSAPRLPRPLIHSSAVTDDHDLYVTGGYDGGQVRSEVYYIKIDPTTNQLVGDWAKDAKPLPKPRYYHQSMIIDHRLYVLGGKQDSNTELNTNYAASLGITDSLQRWDLQYSLVENLYRFGAILRPTLNGDLLYIIGGIHSNSYRENIYNLVVKHRGTVTIQLQHQPVGEIPAEGCVTYIIAYQNGESDLSDVTITNQIPMNTILDLNAGIANDHGNATTQTSNNTVAWTFSKVNAHQSGNVSYGVCRTLGDTLPLINSGAYIKWPYMKEDGTIDIEARASNPVFNSSYLLYLPLIARG